MENGWKGTMNGKPQRGQRSSRERTTSMRDVEAFTKMTGDKNPIHYDSEIVAKTVLGGLVVQGGVTTGLLNAVVAESLPGPGTVFLETNWRLKKAVRVGETIEARVEVIEVRDDKPICTLKTCVVDSLGDICVEGTAVTYTLPICEGR
ncbi:MaoC family dehydratase [Ruegeria atlantica]|uniref:MaoC family dehydratase n=1 Tax=Ruegeria atlantica TaxID=81569 RepID=UPI00147D66E8